MSCFTRTRVRVTWFIREIKMFYMLNSLARWEKVAKQCTHVLLEPNVEKHEVMNTVTIPFYFQPRVCVLILLTKMHCHELTE